MADTNTDTTAPHFFVRLDRALFAVVTSDHEVIATIRGSNPSMHTAFRLGRKAVGNRLRVLVGDIMTTRAWGSELYNSITADEHDAPWLAAQEALWARGQAA